MVDWSHLEMMVRAMGDTTFKCPHCGASYDGSESETAQEVVSLWGDDLHEFFCGECDELFVVRENVTRSFDAVKNYDDLE